MWGNEFRLDGISFLITYKDHYYVEAERRLPQGRTLEPSGGSPLDHIAFSYESIAPVYERMRRDGVEIVRPLEASADFGFDSFMVNGPDGVLVEIVEAEPIPDGTSTSAASATMRCTGGTDDVERLVTCPVGVAIRLIACTGCRAVARSRHLPVPSPRPPRRPAAEPDSSSAAV